MWTFALSMADRHSLLQTRYPSPPVSCDHQTTRILSALLLQADMVPWQKIQPVIPDQSQ